MYHDRFGFFLMTPIPESTGAAGPFSLISRGAVVACNSLSLATYLRGSVVDDEVHHEMHITLLELSNEVLDVLHCPVSGIDISIV